MPHSGGTDWTISRTLSIPLDACGLPPVSTCQHQTAPLNRSGKISMARAPTEADAPERSGACPNRGNPDSLRRRERKLPLTKKPLRQFLARPWVAAFISAWCHFSGAAFVRSNASEEPPWELCSRLSPSAWSSLSPRLPLQALLKRKPPAKRLAWSGTQQRRSAPRGCNPLRLRQRRGTTNQVVSAAVAS